MVTTALVTKRELNGERKHAMNLKPLGDRIIVKQDEAQETTAGGLYIQQHKPCLQQRYGQPS